MYQFHLHSKKWDVKESGKCELCGIPLEESASKTMKICEYCLKDQLAEDDLQYLAWEESLKAEHWA